MAVKPTIQVEGKTIEQGAELKSPHLDPDRVEYVTDRRGRNLGFTRLSMHVRRMAINALSIENSQKPLMIGPALAACCCVSINGEKLDPVTNELQLNARMQRLDTYGIQVLNEAVVQHFPETDEEMVKN